MDNLSDIFTKVKPLFDAVIRKPNAKDIINLNGQLKQVDEQSVQILQNIFLQQLVILVDTVPGENRNELKTHLLECVTTILQKGRLTKAIALKTTLLVAVKLIYDVETGCLRPNLSEEYKLAVLKVISLTTRRVQSDLIEEVYVKDNLKLISQAIFVCVNIVSTERYRKLRFQAVDSILSLLQVHDDFDFSDVVIRCQVAELLFIALPKIIATFVGIINGDEKQGTAVYRIAIKALGRALSLIFEDYSKQDINETFSNDQFRKLTESVTANNEAGNILGLGLRQTHDKSKYFNETTRTREWLLEAEKQVEKALQKVLHLRGHEEELIRLEFAKMNCELLRNCTYNMPTCTVHYLQSVLAMSHDEAERVRKVCLECRQTVASFSISIAGNRMDELFFDALNKMPRTIYRGEEREQIAGFQLITGYLNFFSEAQLTDVFSSPNILEQFIITLLAAAELDGVDELIRREYVSYRFEYEEGFRLQKEKRESRWLVLKNVQSARAKRAFLDVVHALHRHVQPLNTVLLYILDDFFSTRMNSNGYLFLLCELIPKETEQDQDRMETFKNILSEMLQPHHWLLELDENDNILDQKYNALHLCLVLRIISKFAQLMGEHFRWHLYDVLRATLQCSGSTLNCINESAEMALDTVAIAQGLPSIQALLHANLDYISQHVTRCLRRPEQLRDGLCILESVLRFVPYESSDVLESTVTPIIMNILDSHSQHGERNSIVCLRVLQIFIHSIRLRYEEESKLPPEAEEDQKQTLNLAEQIKRLENLLEREVSNEAENPEATDFETLNKEDDPEEAEGDTNDSKMEESNEEESIPPHIKIVLRILSVNYKYLASSIDAERIISLSTINEGIYILQRHENQLLPLVHNIWYNLTERFGDRNPAVVSNAFDLLVTLARLAHDFIRQRSLADVFPKIYKFMTEHCDADASAHQVFKMQCKFLTSIAYLVRDLRMGEKQLDQALEVVRMYLERSERRELKKRAADCLKQMRKLDSLAVFLKCGCSMKYLQ
uniref:Uncharacterized protein n=1 Tax=Anopheles atroparvus TaxID=41427 RepID=A0A182ITA8_ANOAO